MTVLTRLAGREGSRNDPAISIDDYLSMIQQAAYGGGLWGGLNSTYPNAKQETISPAFPSLTALAYKSNGIVFSCMGVRMRVGSEIRFQFRQVRDGKPGNLFGNRDLTPLERPWAGGTTGDLVARAIQYGDIAGNAFMVPSRGGISHLRPDWVTIIAGSMNDPDVNVWDPEAEVLGYGYKPGGAGSGRDPIFYLAEDVAHFAPIPDPDARYRGMSWLTPIIRDVMADKAMTEHKLAFMEHGATPNLVIKLDVPDIDVYSQWIEKLSEEHAGAFNAYKTLYLGAGADATVVGTDLRKIDYKIVQAGGETRIASAAGVPPIIAGLSEGLAAATYSNYGQARRAFSDATMRPLWRNLAGSLAPIIRVPGDAELWYDASDVAFLQEDESDAADILSTQADSIRTFVDAGFLPASAVDAVTSGDLSRLEHSGLFSVQLQPAKKEANSQGLLEGVPIQNGNTPAPA